MRNGLIILLIFVIPLGIFGLLEHYTKNDEAYAEKSSITMNKGKLLKFYSPMCSECKKVGENVNSVKGDYLDKIIFEEVNVSDNSAKSDTLVEAYKITVVPTVVFIDKSGKIQKKSEGMLSEVEIRENLEKIK